MTFALESSLPIATWTCCHADTSFREIMPVSRSISTTDLETEYWCPFVEVIALDPRYARTLRNPTI
jgi:hypothetical protein